MSQQRMCHWICYSIIHICHVWGHIWKRQQRSQPCPREALRLRGCDSATFLNYLIVAGDFKIEMLSAAFYPKWWKASKKHFWDIFLPALLHWASVTINKLRYLSGAFWEISYKATGSLIFATSSTSVLRSNGTLWQAGLGWALCFPRDCGLLLLLLSVGKAVPPGTGVVGERNLAPGVCTV